MATTPKHQPTARFVPLKPATPRQRVDQTPSRNPAPHVKNFQSKNMPKPKGC
jgi:hypothetical protein